MREQATTKHEQRSSRLHEGEPAQAGDPLRSSEERFRKIFHHSNDAIFVMDPIEDSIIDANPRACEMLGYSRDDLLTTVTVSDIHPRVY